MRQNIVRSWGKGVLWIDNADTLHRRQGADTFTLKVEVSVTLFSLAVLCR